MVTNLDKENKLNRMIDRMKGSLTINPRVRMGYESGAHEASIIDSGAMKRNNCFSKIQLVGQTYRDKTTLAS